jgi:hypothetical protein
MATYVPAKRATELIFYMGLVSQSTGQFQVNPTLAAGDVKVSKDGGALANLTTLPAVTPAAGKMVKVTVSSTEMTADNVTLVFSDAAGAEWDDVIINIQTAVQQIDELALASGIPSAATIADAVWDEDATGHQTQGTFGQAIGDPVADTNTIYKAVVTDATGATVGVDVVAVKAETASIQADTDNIQTRIPAALSGDGFMKADLLSIGDELVSSNLATLNLKMLNVVNNAGDAFVAQSTGGGTGFKAHAVDFPGLDVYSDTSVAAAFVSAADDGIYIEAGTGVRHSINLQVTGSGKSINAPQNIAVSDGSLTLAAIASAVWANATRTLTAISDSAGITTLLSRITAALGIYTAADVRGAVGLASANLDTQLDALPTAAENATAVLSAAAANPIDANIQEVNDVTLKGDGSATPWGPV